MAITPVASNIPPVTRTQNTGPTQAEVQGETENDNDADDKVAAAAAQPAPVTNGTAAAPGLGGILNVLA